MTRKTNESKNLYLMKYLSFLLIAFSVLFCSCNKNDEPALNIELPIISVFIPETIDINKTEIDEQERAEIMNLVNNQHIINDVSEVPNDPIGKNEVFYNINYKEQTLLIMYHFKMWPIITYNNQFYRNTQENTYNWVVKLGTTSDFDEDSDTVQLTRFAILVRKLPLNAEVKTWYSLTNLSDTSSN